MIALLRLLGAAGALLAFCAGQDAKSTGNDDVKLPPNTPKPVSQAQLLEFKQDYLDVDFNKDDVMDAQEVRAHFKGGISDVELFQFFMDADKDQSGSISMQEYVNYAAMLA
eukprot:CAMPEP_0169104458 /NCGR_PEP_ID=MMETSP1015-20121227/23267_1 /TAXON_ID=342587 /ORGANISM="Karlodinium micrum, Strain CCMP2283" /LENGTH=110 /DNA_ID=CAMNT_0009165739 /DNA_START=80 /DNA_END=412 /DNA_ORIENTATION=-